MLQPGRCWECQLLYIRFLKCLHNSLDLLYNSDELQWVARSIWPWSVHAHSIQPTIAQLVTYERGDWLAMSAQTMVKYFYALYYSLVPRIGCELPISASMTKCSGGKLSLLPTSKHQCISTPAFLLLLLFKRLYCKYLLLTMANLTQPPTTASKLRALLAGEDIISCPGVYDGFSARIALNTGFKTLYMISEFSLQLVNGM